MKRRKSGIYVTQHTIANRRDPCGQQRLYKEQRLEGVKSRMSRTIIPIAAVIMGMGGTPKDVTIRTLKQVSESQRRLHWLPCGVSRRGFRVEPQRSGYVVVGDVILCPWTNALTQRFMLSNVH